MRVYRPPVTRQPQQWLTIDWGNPFTRGLVGVNNAAAPGLVTRVGTPTRTVYSDKFGGGQAHIADTSSLITKSFPALPSEATMLVYCNVMQGSGATPNNIAAVGTNSAGNQVMVLQSHSTANQLQGLIRVSNGGGTSTVQSASITFAPTAPSDDVFRAWCVVYDGTNMLKLYREGINDVLTNNSTAASGAMTDMDNVSLGGINRGTDAFSNAGTGQRAALAMVWNRALKPSEVWAISQNPWQIYSPPQRRLWAPAAATFHPAWARGSNSVVGAGAVQ